MEDTRVANQIIGQVRYKLNNQLSDWVWDRAREGLMDSVGEQMYGLIFCPVWFQLQEDLDE